MTLRGNTRDFPLDVLLRLLADTKKTGELSMRGTAGEGALGLAEGRVVTAVFGDEPPVPALGAIFDLGPADFEFTPWDEAPAPNLEGDLDDLRRKAEEHRRWLASVREVIPNDRVRFRLSERAADQGAVTFTAERWRVVLAVNGQRNVVDLASQLGVDTYAALDLLAGLVRDGVIETLEPAETQAASWPSAPEPQAPSWPAASEPQAPAYAEPSSQPTAAEPEPPQAPAYSEPEPAAPAYAEPEPQAPAYEEPAATEAPAAEPAAPQPAEPAPSWSAPAADQWAPAAPVEPEQPAAMDDRLAALFGSTPSAPPEPAPAPEQPWSAPATDQWAPPAEASWTPAAPSAPEVPAEDPRLAAMSAPPAAEPQAAEPEATAANEWAPQPSVEAPQRKSLFGRFRREEVAPEPATRTTLVDRSASSRSGLLAAFSNALLTEYNSGHYGKNRVDERMGGLLMRVDEQADPIDRPLPIVDDRLDVQALERTRIPDAQSAPYLATLVATIYADAEKAFGRDKAKRGYKAAQQHVFGGDLSSLASPDVAGKLPKV